MRPAARGAWLGAAAVLLAGAGAPARAAPEHYVLDAAHSMPVFEFLHLGLTTQTGRFSRASGSCDIDFAARKGRVDYEVDAGSLNMGFGTEAPDSPGYRLFEVAKFPKIMFRADRLEFDAGGGVVAAEGNLTLLGVTRPLRVTIDGFRCKGTPTDPRTLCTGDIHATIRRSEFGMIGYIPNISDEIRVHVPVEAYRKRP